jgi:toxin ParE1/3/4
MPLAYLSVQAEIDLLEIAYQIAITDHRPEVAEKNIDEISAKCQLLANSPLIGTMADELFEGCRLGRHKRWVIFSRIRDEGIDVVRIVDGARDYPSLFR